MMPPLAVLRSNSRLASKFPSPNPSSSSFSTDSTGTASAPRTLSSIFLNRAKNPRNRERKWVPSTESARRLPLAARPFPAELSPEATSLVSRLREEGYLKEALLSRGAPFNANGISPGMYRSPILTSAAERFGQDHQEIAKWLSGSELKKVALFGCPSVERRTVFAAKRLRSFFNAPEILTCRICKLRSSCKFANWRAGGQGKRLILSDVMRVLTLYTIHAIPQNSWVTGDVKSSVFKLLKEVLSLSS